MQSVHNDVVVASCRLPVVNRNAVFRSEPIMAGSSVCILKSKTSPSTASIVKNKRVAQPEPPWFPSLGTWICGGDGAEGTPGKLLMATVLSNLKPVNSSSKAAD